MVKDKKITILTSTWQENEMGDQFEVKVPFVEKIWAYYRQASANEFNGAAQVGYKVEAIFKIGWRDDLSTDMTILFRGQEYGITRIDDFEGYKQDLTIHAHTINY